MFKSELQIFHLKLASPSWMGKFLRPKYLGSSLLPLVLSYLLTYDANPVDSTLKRYPESDWFHHPQATSLLPTSYFFSGLLQQPWKWLVSTLNSSSLVSTQQPDWSFKIMSDHVTSQPKPFSGLQVLPGTVSETLFPGAHSSPTQLLPHWPPCCSLNLASTCQSQSTCCSLCLKPPPCDTPTISAPPTFMSLQKYHLPFLTFLTYPCEMATPPPPHSLLCLLCFTLFHRALIFLWHIIYLLISLLPLSPTPHT